jgi:tetratricopeptide (TPR) repeat protein
MADIEETSSLSKTENVESLRCMENFVLIWFDSNIKETSQEYHDSILLLQRYVNSIILVSDQLEYSYLIQHFKKEKLFIIVSGTFGSTLADVMEKTSHIYSVYVYCGQRQYHEEWATNFPKIKGVFTDIAPICDALRRDIRQANNDLIPIHILSSTNPDLLFICSVILKDVLIHSEFNNQIGREFIQFCRLNYKKNPYELDIVNNFGKNYNQLSPIQWYTRECFIYSMINRALRVNDIEILGKIIFFIQQLHQQIEELYSQSNEQQQLTVYYGQGISNDQFLNLKTNVDSIISFNTFLFTTIDEQVSLDFAEQSRNNSDLIGVIFKIDIDRTKSSIPFVILDGLDYFNDSDRHVLFSLNAFFRIIQCKQLEHRLWQIDLRLIEDNDDKMQTITEWIKTKFGELVGFPRLGQMMINMGEIERAQKLFLMLLECTPDDDNEKLADIHHNLGYINEEKNTFDVALKHYNEDLKFRSKYLSPDDFSLGTVYASIGKVLHKQGHLDEALENFQNAVDYISRDQQCNPATIADYYNSIGLILIDKDELLKARDSFKKALKFQKQNSTPTADNIFSDIHANLSTLNERLEQYENAKEHGLKQEDNGTDQVKIDKEQKHGYNLRPRKK